MYKCYYMLFTKEIGIEEIINQIMFGFVKKTQLCVLFTKVPWHFPPTLCRASVCRLQQNIQTAQDVALWLPSS